VREADFAGPWCIAAADQPRLAHGMMRRPKRPIADPPPGSISPLAAESRWSR
jgi:hypothetical protein